MIESEKGQHDEDAQDADDTPDNERINDPLTRSDVKAPRVPFGSEDA